SVEHLRDLRQDMAGGGSWPAPVRGAPLVARSGARRGEVVRSSRLCLAPGGSIICPLLRFGLATIRTRRSLRAFRRRPEITVPTPRLGVFGAIVRILPPVFQSPGTRGPERPVPRVRQHARLERAHPARLPTPRRRSGRFTQDQCTPGRSRRPAPASARSG